MGEAGPQGATRIGWFAPIDSENGMVHLKICKPLSYVYLDVVVSVRERRPDCDAQVDFL